MQQVIKLVCRFVMKETMQMIPVPYSVMNDYGALLRVREISPAHVEHYKKWLRYFYDFSANYLDSGDKPEKVKLFLEKLRSKNQTPVQCQTANARRAGKIPRPSFSAPACSCGVISSLRPSSQQPSRHSGS